MGRVGDERRKLRRIYVALGYDELSMGAMTATPGNFFY